jgi:hypothetical protein
MEGFISRVTLVEGAAESTGFFRPNGAQDDSPGQRPGTRITSPIQALKGRNNGGRLCDDPSSD